MKEVCFLYLKNVARGEPTKYWRDWENFLRQVCIKEDPKIECGTVQVPQGSAF